MVSRYGMVLYASSLDTVGIMAKEVGVVRKVFDVVSRMDERDGTMVPEDVRKQCDGFEFGDGKVTVGIPQVTYKDTSSNMMFS